MSRIEKFIVLPYTKMRGGLVTGSIRQAPDAARATRIAAIMAPRHAGVAAYSVQMDVETGTMSAPRMLVKFGETARVVAV